MCGAPIERQTPQQIVDQVLEMEAGVRFQVLAPVVRTRKGEFVDLFAELQTQGFSRGQRQIHRRYNRNRPDLRIAITNG